MKDFIIILLEIAIIPVLDGLLINLIYDKIKNRPSTGNRRDGKK
ncbi:MULTISPECIES: hypothetical protein [Peptostreptococcales]|nr:hypothetical protein [Peptoclostridium sp. AF21-18]